MKQNQSEKRAVAVTEFISQAESDGIITSRQAEVLANYYAGETPHELKTTMPKSPWVKASQFKPVEGQEYVGKRNGNYCFYYHKNTGWRTVEDDYLYMYDSDPETNNFLILDESIITQLSEENESLINNIRLAMGVLEKEEVDNTFIEQAYNILKQALNPTK